MEPLKLSYKISKEEFLEGYDIFYQKKKKKSTIIKAVMFLVVLVLFIQQVIIDPYYTMGWICIIICVGAIACIFATPKMERNSYERAVKALIDDTYELTLTKEKLTVSTVLADSDNKYLEVDKDGNTISHPKIVPTEIDLLDKHFRAYETENVFSVMNKDISLTIPKSKLTKYDIEAIRDTVKPEKITLK